ncbi:MULTISPECIES: IclR family transcriptional regulator [Burkholderia]|uniref:IclR family transcriptional regulator n=1 Tax=Burkholderia paludis TaxID=1506587 RepID=A0A6J5DEU3_9BURK|nr:MULTISPECIES: IclR family transcriptional regulator [Burkholderia]CAB3751336.1 HTH-type transcriptional regulator SrpS [Burkholderia paludis]VWB07480.1 IclR family transcriptional regulator [Burkholderia paludis]
MDEIQEPEADGASGKQVIARAVAVLRALEGQSVGLSLSQIARAAALPRTTVHRLVNALEAQGFVATGSAGIRLGPALIRLAASAHMDVVAVAKPFADALSRRTRETVDICVIRGAHAISVDQYLSDQELRVGSSIGTAFPLHCTAHGKVLLSLLKDDEVASLLEHPLQRRTPATVVEQETLLRSLAEIRDLGYAVDREEHASGVCGLGVAIETASPQSYAMALAVPALRFEARFEDLLAALRQTKSEIESALGATRAAKAVVAPS